MQAMTATKMNSSIISSLTRRSVTPFSLLKIQSGPYLNLNNNDKITTANCDLSQKIQFEIAFETRRARH